jgi:nifR3 family TIM-barrel protein
MIRGFWDSLDKPIMVLAPMSDVTDAPFRYMIAKYGKPDVMFTEFVSVDGLCSEGRANLLRDLIFDESERPVVAQLFGETPDNFRRAAELVRELGFDGIDINMGCPVKVVTKTGAGAALILTPELAKDIIRATQEGAGGLPVSVKTRIGYNSIVIDEWLPHLLEVEPAAVTLHLRTRKEMSDVDAHWDVMREAAEIAADSDTLLLGNGDVRDLDHANELVAQTGIDGIMLGRAIYGNPWLFDRSRRHGDISVDEKLEAMIEHARLFEKILGGRKNFAVMKKHLRSYASGFPGSKDLRVQLMETAESAEDVRSLVDAFHQSGYGKAGRTQVAD